MVDRLYFEEIGLLDEGMEVYGGENVELGIRVSTVMMMLKGHIHLALSEKLAVIMAVGNKVAEYLIFKYSFKSVIWLRAKSCAQR